MQGDDLPLEMRIDLEIRDVLIRHKKTAWKVMEYDLLPALNRHWCSSKKEEHNISKDDAVKEWLQMMHNQSRLSNEERSAEGMLRRILWDYGAPAWKVMDERVDDLNKHLWYSSQWARRDIGRDNAINDWLNKYTKYLHNKELLEIEYAYKNGEYAEDEQDLYAFVKTHCDQIEQIQQTMQSKMKKSGKYIDLLEATRILFTKLRTVNPQRDIKAQLKEIEKELWIQQAKDENTRRRVVTEWSKNYAPGWRDHKAMIIEYILNVQAEKFRRIFQELHPPRIPHYANAC